MMKSLPLIAILVTAQLATAVDILGGDAGDFEKRLMSAASHRELVSSTCNNLGEIHYFEVYIRVEPGGDEAPKLDETGMCAIEDQVMLGHAINLMLLDYVSYEQRTHRMLHFM